MVLRASSRACSNRRLSRKRRCRVSWQKREGCRVLPTAVVGGEHPALSRLAGAASARIARSDVGMPFVWRGSLLNSVGELRAA